jgi:hypothetical protein
MSRWFFFVWKYISSAVVAAFIEKLQDLHLKPSNLVNILGLVGTWELGTT